MRSTRPTSRIITLPALIGAGVTLAAALLTRLAVGSPLAVLHKLGAAAILPPLWLMSLVWLASFASAGAIAGYLLACPAGHAARETALWRGATFFVLAMVFSLVWYTLLFGKLCLLPSWLCLFLSAASAAVCGLSWGKLFLGGAWILFGFAVWQTVLILFQLCILLQM